MARIAFIGLGNMGSGMAANLAKAGHEVRAFDLSEAALAKAGQNGCARAGSAAEAVAVRAPGPMHGGLGSGLVGDTIGNPKVHGGDDQAVAESPGVPPGILSVSVGSPTMMISS